MLFVTPSYEGAHFNLWRWRFREWKSFRNGARTDSLRLSHWTKAGTDPEVGEHCFLMHERILMNPFQNILLQNITPSLMSSHILKTSTLDSLKVRIPLLSDPPNLSIGGDCVDPGWTKEETDYLFQLVREFDGRFYIVHDRYEYPNGTPRSLEVCDN